MVPLLVKLLSEKAKLPQRCSELSAGYDLFSSEDAIIPARGKALIQTGIAIKVPPGTYGRIAPRSGLALKFGLNVGAGVIDEDYRGPIGVLLFNHSDNIFTVSVGDRVAQLILEKIEKPEVMSVKFLDETERGSDGFGSTGMK